MEYPEYIFRRGHIKNPSSPRFSNHRAPNEAIQAFINGFISRDPFFNEIKRFQDELRKIQQAVDDGYLPESLAEQFAEDLNILTEETQNYKYDSSLTPEVNGAKFYNFLHKINHLKRRILDTLQRADNYYEPTKNLCNYWSPTSCETPCAIHNDECIYPYSKEQYKSYWTSNK
jgi:hypothetical protein